MLLGKRTRPGAGMKRTTSMTDTINHLGEVPPSNPILHHHDQGSSLDQRLTILRRPDMVSPSRNQRRHSAEHSFLDMIMTVHHHDHGHDQGRDFLRSCSLCRRPLLPGRDIYMYRGDTGFCSQECRQLQMNQDEKQDRYSSFQPTKNKAPRVHHQNRAVNIPSPSPAALAAPPVIASNSETVAL